MPVHDWTRVISGIFHDFHQTWIPEIKNVLNNKVLPEGFYALAEQIAEGPQPWRPTRERPSVGRTSSKR